MSGPKTIIWSPRNGEADVPFSHGPRANPSQQSEEGRMSQERMRSIAFRLASWILICASAGCQASGAVCSDAANTTPRARPVVGAIRFDAWQPGSIGNRYIGFL